MNIAFSFILILSIQFNFLYSSRLLAVGSKVDNILANDSLIISSLFDELREQGSNGNYGDWPYNSGSGWGLLYYNDASFDNLINIRRSEIPANEDPTYVEFQNEILSYNNGAIISLGHVRRATTGSVNIPNPHPFIFQIDDKTITFAHNGTMEKEVIMDLITDNGTDSTWINNNPPNTHGCGPWQNIGWSCVVDSELYFLWVIKCINDKGDLEKGIIEAIVRVENVWMFGSYGVQKNFILTDGENLYAYRSYVSDPNNGQHHEIYFTDSTQVDSEISFNAIMSTIPLDGPGSLLDWGTLDNFSLLVINGDDNMDFIHNVKYLSLGCMDNSACNYDAEATYDNGSCAFEFDCAGECGGMTVEDCTGECAGMTVVDCAGECGGLAMEDCSGQCNGTLEYDCAGECDGDAVEDICGTCNGTEIDSANCIYEGFSLSLTNVDLIGGTLDIVMNNSESISQFQFIISGINIITASGGSAESNGFYVEAGGIDVNGFNFIGNDLPPSNSILLNINFNEIYSDICLFEVVLYDIDGNDIDDVSVGDCHDVVGLGCMDDSACNYNADAIFGDNSCWYANEGCTCDDGEETINFGCGCGEPGPEENYDCEGNCSAELDCTGECAGMTVVDCAGECGGLAMEDCSGQCNGTLEYDCAGECDGDAVEDICGTCNGTEINSANCIYEGFLLSFANVDMMSGTLDVVMNNSEPIASFQFEVEGITNISSISGGTAEENGLEIVSSGTVVIGFSLTGVTIPPGNTTLVSVFFDEIYSDLCFSNILLVDPNGIPYDVSSGDCHDVVGLGCQDVSACNYDATAIIADDSCWYVDGDCTCEDGEEAIDFGCGCGEPGPDENYDCEGNCLAELDCSGECGGEAFEVVSCEDTDGDGLGNPGSETIECVVFSNGNVGQFCGDGMIFDCWLQCIEEAALYSLIGDGYCDDNTWGIYLDCPEFDCDGLDCPELFCDGGEPEFSCENYGLVTCSDASCAEYPIDCPSTDSCSACEFDYTASGTECCDSAYEEFGMTCYDLELFYDWDCSGCNCIGDILSECGDGQCTNDENPETCSVDCDGICSEDEIIDCVDGDWDCCPESWIGDGFPDCEDQQWGCDLSCYDNDGGDCDGMLMSTSSNIDSQPRSPLSIEGKDYYVVQPMNQLPFSRGLVYDCNDEFPDCYFNYYDCNEDCGGSAELDCAGECDGIALEDCTGLCNGTAELDCAGVCNGNSDVDCFDVCGGSASLDIINECCDIEEFDICNKCDGNSYDYCDGDSDGLFNIEDWGYGAHGFGDNLGILVEDIPGDQGGKVYITFHKSFYDTDTLRSTESYQIERLDEGWIGVATQNAYGSSIYTVEVSTLIDSSNTEHGLSEFRIISNMEEGNYVSLDDENGFGYSIDNIHPSTPNDVMASSNDNDINLSWGYSQDIDFSYHQVNQLGIPEYTIDNEQTMSLGTDYNEYYMNSVDIHNNYSDKSDYVGVHHLHQGANLIGICVLPDDNSIGNVISGPMEGMIGAGVAAVPNPLLGWVGSLTHIQPNLGYWLKASEETIHLTVGDKYEAEFFELDGGANLTSYCCANDIPLNEIDSDCIEGIIGEGVSASWIDEIIVGSLTALSTGQGYWVKTSEECALEFECTEYEQQLVRVDKSETIKDYAQSTQQAFYFIEDIENIEVGDIVSSYCDNTKVGSRVWNGAYTDIPAMGNDNSDLTKDYCQINQVPAFRVKKLNGETYVLTGDIPSWESNGLHMLSTLQEEAIILPESYRLAPAYPNPFNPTTTINFAIPADTDVSISIYDLQGREVVSLASGSYGAGYHSVTWNADSHSSGVYFVKMVAGSYINIQKLMLVK